MRFRSLFTFSPSKWGGKFVVMALFWRPSHHVAAMLLGCIKEAPGCSHLKGRITLRPIRVKVDPAQAIMDK